MTINKTERWLVEHSIRIFVVFAALAGLGAYLVIHLLSAQSETQEQINVLRPQVTKVIRAASVCNPEALLKRQASRDCAKRLRVALLNCRDHPACRAAFLATLQPPPQPSKSRNAAPKVVMPQHSPPASQRPKPGHRRPGGAKRPAPPRPAPSAPAAAEARHESPPVPPPSGSEAPTTPGNSGNTPAPEHSQGVHACVEIVVSACVEAGADG